MAFLSLIGYGIIALGMIGLWQVKALFAHDPLLVAVQVAAALLMIWARITFGLRSFHPGADPTAGGLVIHGPYHVIRHPIYAAICLFVIGGVAGNCNTASVMLALLIFAGAIVRAHCEETLLLARYPEYKAYSRRTSRMIPKVY
jgi:protein-S-isoprenylcysteine O-methyltransferase Ste14